MAFIKGFLFSIFLTFITFSSYANEECIYTSKDYQNAESLTKQCLENIKQYSTMNKLGNDETDVNKSSYKDYLNIGSNALKGNIEVTEDLSSSLMKIGFSVIVAIMTFISILAIIFVSVSKLVSAASGGKPDFSSFAITVLSKISASIFSKAIIIYCFSVGFGIAGAISYVVLNYNVDRETSQTNIKRIIADSAKEDALIKANTLINYAVCNINYDKFVFATEHFDNEYRFDDGSQYSKCMRESDETTLAEDSSKNYNSKYFKKFLNCSRSHAGVGSASCMSSNFSAEQQEFKKFLNENEDLVYSIADNVIRYSCANTVAINKHESHDFIRYCYDLNYKTREIIYSDSGRVQVIKTSPSYNEIKASVNTLTEKIKQKNISVAIDEIKENFKRKEYQINEVNTFMSFVYADTDSKELKNLAEKSFNYQLVNNTVLRFSADDGLFDAISSYLFDDDIKLPEVNDRVLGEVEKLTSNKDGLKDLIYPVVDFFGNDILKKFGFEDDKEKTISPFIIGNVFSAALHSSTIVAEFFIASKTTAAVASLDSQLRTTSKPTIFGAKLYAFADFVSSKLFVLLLLCLGLIGYIIYVVAKSYMTSMYIVFEMFIKMFGIKDTALLLDQNKNGFKTWSGIFIPAMIVLFSASFAIISFILSNVILYIVVFVMSKIMPDIFIALGMFDISDVGNMINTIIFWIIFYFFLMLAFSKSNTLILNMIFNQLVSYVSGSQNRELNNMMGNKASETSIMNQVRPKGRL